MTSLRVVHLVEASDPHQWGDVTIDLADEGITVDGPDGAACQWTWPEFMAWLRAANHTARAYDDAEEARRELAAARALRAQAADELARHRALTAKLDRLRAIGEGRIALGFCPRCKVGVRSLGPVG